MQKHFAHFLSPGTFCSEATKIQVPMWAVDWAKNLAAGIRERHNAKPYGFYFTTEEQFGDWTVKEIKRSGMYYLGGTILTLAQVKARNDPKDETLIWNMEHNDYKRVIVNTNSWKITLPFRDEDCII